MVTALIFGNGLGMAIDPSYFLLTTAINSVWNGFSEEERKLISFNENIQLYNEDMLETHHGLLTVYKKIEKFNLSDRFFTRVVHEFARVYPKFIYQVAEHFFHYEGKLPQSFSNNLINFIKNRNISCVATLNYDKLIYEPFIENEVVKGYDGELIDGIWQNTTGFSPENMEQKQSKFGWYLTLHGSPIYYTDEEHGLINKSHIGETSFNKNREHIVLAPTEQKPHVISDSFLLANYFNCFRRAINKSDNIILFGYSGNDIHINTLIVKRVNSAKHSNKNLIVNIIEWNGLYDEVNRKDYWTALLNTPINLMRYDNILEHRF